MRSICTVAVFLSLSVISNAQYTWHSLSAAPLSWRFDDFYFVTPQMGWAINPNYDYLAPTQYGRIFKTTDGGDTWQKLVDSSNTFYRSVGFADSLNGWVGNLADTATYMGVPFTADTVPFYETHDGGISWAPVNLPHPHPAGICGISVVTDSVVFAYGRFFGPAGYVKTTDKGASWTFTGMDSLAFGLVDGHFFNKDTGFITGMASDHTAMILYTVNGGQSWTYAYHSTRADTDRVWKIFFPSRNVGYASIEFGGSQTIYDTWYLKTTDGGLTWTEHVFAPSYDEEGIGFINDSTGWIGGDFLHGTYITQDGGNTWNIDTTFGVSTMPYAVTGSAYSINRFRKFSDTLMYASGNTIYKLSVPNTGVKEVANYDHDAYNFPNPFSTSTTIVYTLRWASDDVLLEVTNVLGQRVFTKHLGKQNSGKHQYIFGEQLPAGVYYYSISNGVFKSTGKMVAGE